KFAVMLSRSPWLRAEPALQSPFRCAGLAEGGATANRYRSPNDGCEISIAEAAVGGPPSAGKVSIGGLPETEVTVPVKVGVPGLLPSEGGGTQIAPTTVDQLIAPVKSRNWSISTV